jgi:LmbE family N-acetylglucosaminyl deacetylase
MNILAFFAHPDDETMLAGGVLALLARAGGRVHYLCATRGEGGEIGEPPLCLVEELGAIRTQETICAMHALAGKSINFLDYADPRIGPNDTLYTYTNKLNELVGKVIEIIKTTKTEVMITHGSNGEYGHPAHITTYLASRQAVMTLGDDAPYLYSVSAAFPDHPKPRHINHKQTAHMVLDVTPVLEQKIQAALCHRTQNALFVRRASKKAGRQLRVQDVILTVESLHRVYPAVTGHLDDLVAKMLEPWRIDIKNEVGKTEPPSM